MEKKEVNRLIKNLLTDQLNWEEKEKLSRHKLVEERMKRQWRHATENPQRLGNGKTGMGTSGKM
jgi:hypothetical protein